MTATAKREPRTLGKPRRDWHPDLTAGYQGKDAPLLDTNKQRNWRKTGGLVPAPGWEVRAEAVTPGKARTLVTVPEGWGDAVKAARTRLGLSLPQAAALVGVPRGTLSRWEQTAVRMDPTRFEAINAALGIGVGP